MITTDLLMLSLPWNIVKVSGNLSSNSFRRYFFLIPIIPFYWGIFEDETLNNRHRTINFLGKIYPSSSIIISHFGKLHVLPNSARSTILHWPPFNLSCSTFGMSSFFFLGGIAGLRWVCGLLRLSQITSASFQQYQES